MGIESVIILAVLECCLPSHRESQSETRLLDGDDLGTYLLWIGWRDKGWPWMNGLGGIIFLVLGSGSSSLSVVTLWLASSYYHLVRSICHLSLGYSVDGCSCRGCGWRGWIGLVGFWWVFWWLIWCWIQMGLIWDWLKCVLRWRWIDLGCPRCRLNRWRERGGFHWCRRSHWLFWREVGRTVSNRRVWKRVVSAWSLTFYSYWCCIGICLVMIFYQMICFCYRVWPDLVIQLMCFHIHRYYH
jgi:hypothetical protein